LQIQIGWYILLLTNFQSEEESMQIYDVSLTISPDIIIWPGDPPVTLERISKLEDGDVANVTKIVMSVHVGTHVDAPSHFIEGGRTVDTLPIKTLTGRAYVLSLPEADEITAEILENADIPPRTRRLLFKTRNSNLWANNHHSFHENYVAISQDGAEYLVRRGVKLVGVDYLSVAPFDRVTPTHEILLKAGVVVVEGLNLSQVQQGRYTIYCLPLKIAKSDGAPARVVLVGV
jgi:arylformamidase